MTKELFKKRWDSNGNGGGITFDDIADCAISWGITSSPRTCKMDQIVYKVLKAADVSDVEIYAPSSD